VRVEGDLACNDGELLYDWVKLGLGIGWRSTWEILAELKRGELVTVLDDFAAPNCPIQAVYPQQRYLPAIAAGELTATMALASSGMDWQPQAINAAISVGADGNVLNGSYALVAEGSTLGSGAYAGHAVLTAAGLERLVVRLDSTGVLLDDFEDGDIAWSLRDLFGYSWWWLRASVPPDSMIRIYGITEIAQGIQGGGGGRWLGIHISDSVPAPEWSNFGLDLGLPQARLPTLSHLTAVRLKVRGQGVWTLRLATHSATRADTWIGELPVDTAWTTIRMPVSDFVLEGSGKKGLATTDRLRNLVFQATGVGRLDVDDIVLEGVQLQDWLLP
jgi:hypothetical protein